MSLHSLVHVRNGSSCRVYRCQWVHASGWPSRGGLEVAVAIKKLNHKSMYHREVNILRKLVAHPCLVGCLSVIPDSNSIVMPLYAEDGFDALGRAAKTLSQSQWHHPANVFFATRVVAQVLLALHYIHAAGMVHNDVKLENVFLTPCRFRPGDTVIQYTASLGDMGLCNKKLSVGTRMYWPPELAAVGHRLEKVIKNKQLFDTLERALLTTCNGVQKDLWGAAVCYYQMLNCGYFPAPEDYMKSENTYSLEILSLRNSNTIQWKPLSGLMDSVEAMREWFQRDPAMRPQSAQDMLQGMCFWNQYVKPTLTPVLYDNKPSISVRLCNMYVLDMLTVLNWLSPKSCSAKLVVVQPVVGSRMAIFEDGSIATEWSGRCGRCVDLTPPSRVAGVDTIPSLMLRTAEHWFDKHPITHRESSSIQQLCNMQARLTPSGVLLKSDTQPHAVLSTFKGPAFGLCNRQLFVCENPRKSHSWRPVGEQGAWTMYNNDVILVHELINYLLPCYPF